ncbi:MAG TPA: hypothetical protein VGG09_15095 [Acidimicrobiales bacterium]|jgi:hypothetical protein
MDPDKARLLFGHVPADFDPDDPADPGVVEEMQDRLERRWCDEAVPALGGQTPRRAAADPALREQLERVVQDFERLDRDADAYPMSITMRPWRLRELLDLNASQTNKSEGSGLVRCQTSSPAIYGARRILWPPTRRHRAAEWRPPASATCTHSHVARPSGPEKLHVISKTPGAPSTDFTRSRDGHGARSATLASQASLNSATTTLNSSRSLFDRRL